MSDLLNQNEYKPDIVFGYNGQKVYLNILRNAQTMEGKPDGEQAFRQRMVEALNPEVKHFNVPISSVVDYNIEGMKLELKKYDLQTELNQVFGQKSSMDFS